MEGNVFFQGAKPSKHEKAPTVKPQIDPPLKLVEKADGFYLEFPLDKDWIAGPARRLVTSELLGKATIPNLPYERPDGTPLRIDTDYFGHPQRNRSPARPLREQRTGRTQGLVITVAASNPWASGSCCPPC